MVSEEDLRIKQLIEYTEKNINSMERLYIQKCDELFVTRIMLVSSLVINMAQLAYLFTK
jgi:hypothetical protein